MSRNSQYDIVETSWKRKGFFYEAILKWSSPHPKDKTILLISTITRRLDFISYHLIKRIHGEEGLKQMAYLKKEIEL